MEKRFMEEIGGELLLGLLDNPYESLILVDKKGVVRFMSSANEGAYPVSVKDAVGRPVQEVSPGTRIHLALETGRAEIGEAMMINGKRRVVARFPLFNAKGEIVGAAGKLMFLHPGRLKELYDKIELLETRLDYYKNELSRTLGSRYGFAHIIGESPEMVRARELAKKAAGSDSPVMIVGETGTGKELFAHAIHGESRRRKNALVRVNCAAIPHDLFESELFGYTPGAFTGADRKGKAGKFELAHKGTIFLDEIGEMPISMQTKLLRVLQEKEIEPIGAKAPKKIDFRLISATNRDIDTLVEKGAFRLDLFYRINLMTIHLPPLRRIKSDIPLLANHFLSSLATREKRYRFSPEAMEAMANYRWPGNMRELRNVVERAVIMCDGNEIRAQDLPAVIQRATPGAKDAPKRPRLSTLKERVSDAERSAITEAMEMAQGNISLAARLLGIHRTGLYQKLKKHNIR